MELITNFFSALVGDNLYTGLADIGAILITDIVLSADNALIIGLAAAGLPVEQRKKAIFWGMAIAAGLRIFFTIIVSQLLGVPFIRLIGAMLLIWVCWTLYKEIRDQQRERNEEAKVAADPLGHKAAETETKARTLGSALLAIAIADVSMSLDNVLAVAQLAGHNTTLLIFGLVLAIIMMAFFATLIMKLLERFPIISWLGLIVLCYVAGEMLYHGIIEAMAYLNGEPLPSAGGGH